MEKINHSESSEVNSFDFDTLLKFVYGELNNEMNQKIEDSKQKDIDIFSTLIHINRVKNTNNFVSYQSHREWLDKTQKEMWSNLQESLNL